MEHMNVFGEDLYNNFKKDEYYAVEKFLTETKPLCLVAGPRKVGKTIILKQIAKKYSVEYFSFKEDPEGVESHFRNIDLSKGIYLFDEMTYCDLYDKVLIWLAGQITDRIASGLPVNAKIIISGSQAVALRYFIDIHFASTAKIVEVGFLSYSEFLKWRNLSCSKESFTKFIYEAWKFHGIDSNREYIQESLIETGISCNNSYSQVPALKFTEEETLLPAITKLLFMIVFKLHNNTTWKRAGDINKIIGKIIKDYVTESGEKPAYNLYEAFTGTLAYKALACTKLSFTEFRNALMFLVKSGLVIFNFNEGQVPTSVYQWLNYGIAIDGITSVTEFFSEYNILISYPSFYVNVIREVLQELPHTVSICDFIAKDTFGSILECYLKGCYAKKRGITYVIQWEAEVQGKMHQIDLVTDDCTLIEISVGKKSDSDVHFDYYPDNCYKKLIVCDGSLPEDRYKRVPYWEYAFSVTSIQERAE